MTADESTLRYESRIGGALAPGERVLWEDRPHLPAPRENFIRVAIGIVVFLAILGGVIAAAVSHDTLFTIFVIIVCFVCGGIIDIYLWHRGDPTQPELRHIIYRITNRRFIRADERPRKPYFQTLIDEVSHLTVVHGRKRTITIDHVQFEALPEVNSILLRVLDLWARSGRRRKVRRLPVNDAMNTPGPSIDAATLPPEIALMPGERVLWSGKPRPRDPFDRAWMWKTATVLFWLLIPAFLLIASSGKVSWLSRPHWAFTLLAACWVLAALNAMILHPIQATRRRARSTYVLTNIRAIVHLAGHNAQVRSHLLDMAGTASIDRRPDGVFDVWIGSLQFERIHDGERLHAIALEVIRVAGTPADGILRANQD